MSRSSSLARDTLHLGRVMPMEEICARIDALTVDQVRDFAIEFAPTKMALVTIGPEQLYPSAVADVAAAV